MVPHPSAWPIGIACRLPGTNTLAVLAFPHRKRMARPRKWRIPERMLVTVALPGGCARAARAPARPPQDA
jgi:uncharacterized membrane protein YsdA (DUF1294 family)